MGNFNYLLKLKISFVFVLLFVSCQGVQDRKISSLNTQFDDFISELSQREPFYGNILVKKDGVVQVERSYGLASLEWDLKNTNESKFMLASVSKQFTAAAVMTLVNQGKLSYDDHLTKYFPEESVHPKNIESLRKITIRDLLAHRSGLLKDLQADFINLNQHYKLRDLSQRLLKDERLLSHPYGKFYYSNIGYMLLARIVEIVSRFDFDMYLRFKLFKTMGLANSGVYHRSEIIPHMTSGYYRDEDDKFRKYCCYDSSTNMGSHNLYSTARDLSLWVEELTNENNLLGESFLDFQNVPSEKGIQYFNGLYRKGTDSGPHYWHDGFSGGFASRISFFPEKNLTIVILLNRVNVFTAQPQIEAIHKELLKQYN